MSYVNIVVLPTPYNVEFKCVGGLIFDINYVEYNDWLNNIYWFNSKERLHRENGSAIIWKNGEQCWFRYGKLHRKNGPAGIWKNREQVWYLNGIYYPEEKFNEEIRRRHELRKSKLLTNNP